ncbi:MAG: CHRD domain-containing protein [Ferruginibacter sp.]
MKKIQSIIALAGMIIISASCQKDAATVPATVVREWTVKLNTQNHLTIPAGRSETGTVKLELMSNNSLRYTIQVNGLAGGDLLSSANIHTGNAGKNGPLVFPITTIFSSGNAAGTIENVRNSFADSLEYGDPQLYVNIASAAFPAGLLRGQVNTDVEVAVNVTLSGSNLVPPVTTTATGTAVLRLTSEKRLYSTLLVSNAPAGDAFSRSHIHLGTADINGVSFVRLADNAGDFNVLQTIQLTDAEYSTLKLNSLYVLVRSNNYLLGILRGQIR